ncbi:hypothetical protein CFIO01_04458 [Colletotrichum fioriniae PJ7]|uniref:Uncharacterized protein n=1 Tax=Colletotrichum fioriniae PJ7 TaxID=1445577 RepID=A0A010S0N9_9PEZI|nr:hypothetical protein CFIO01_04458 [Colletotrichum fioriniae PJ7]
MSQNPTSNSPAESVTSPFGYLEKYGHLAPTREKPTHDFDDLEESLSVRINDQYINCFRLVASGKNTTGTGCGLRIHAFTNDSECKDIAMKGKREDVQVTAAPKDKLADEVTGEIMAISLGNQGCIVILVYFKKADLGLVGDDEWVKVLLDAEYKEDVIPQWEDLGEWVELFPRKSARSPVEDISSVPLSDVFLRNRAPMMNLDIVPDAYSITFLAIVHIRFAVLEIIHPIQFIERVIGGGGSLAVTRFTDGQSVYFAGPLCRRVFAAGFATRGGVMMSRFHNAHDAAKEAPEERRTGRQAGADDVEADFGGRCRVGEDGCLADVVRYTGHRTEDPEEKRSGNGDKDDAGQTMSHSKIAIVVPQTQHRNTFEAEKRR